MHGHVCDEGEADLRTQEMEDEGMSAFWKTTDGRQALLTLVMSDRALNKRQKKKQRATAFTSSA